MNKKLRKLVYLAMFTTLAVALHIFEGALAIPLPSGIKLGFANIVALIVIEIFSAKDMVVVNFLRVILAGLLGGSIFSYPWFISLGGVILSSLAIMICKRCFGLPIVSLSIMSALFHGIGQIIVVVYIYQSLAIASWIIVLFASSIPTGIFTGMIASTCLHYLKNRIKC